MRSAHTAARGIMIVNVTIITANRICIKYARNAVSAPTSSEPSITRWAPNHRTATDETLNMNITVGYMSAWSLPTRSALSVSERLASSKRAASIGSRTNARTTRMPMICSRSTRLTLLMRGCIARNSGIMREMMNAIEPAMIGTTIRSSFDSAASSRSAITIPPTHMIGDCTSIVAPISTSIWICVMSFVVRVISDGAPNLPTSRAEKLPM